jgi:integrase
MAVSQESQWLGAKDGALHLQRYEACLQIRCQVGILKRESNGREACRIGTRLDEANETTSAINAAWFFLLLTKLPLRERLAVAFSGWVGPRISEAFGLKWQDLDLDAGVVTFRRGFVQGRITLLKTEPRERICRFLRQWRSITPHPTENDWVFASPYTKGERPFWPAQLLKTHIKPVALKAGLPSIAWHSFRHTVSAWGKEAGLELEDVKTLRQEKIATTSEIYGHLGLEAKRRIQQRLINFVKEQVRATIQ